MSLARASRMSRLVLGCALLVAACKSPSNAPSDGGVPPSDSADAGSDSSAHDTTAPSLVSVIPSQGDTWLHEPIRLVFDEALDASSLAALDITATIAGASTSASLSLEDPHTILVEIDPAARGIGALDVHIAGAIADLAGNAYTSPIDVHLNLPAWSGRPIDRGAAVASPALAVTDHGAVYAAWTIGSAGSHHVVVSALDRGAWQSLGDTLRSDATCAAIAIDAMQRPM